MKARNCKALNARGEPCRGTPMRRSDYCVFHDPEHAEVVQQARSAGGQRRKREVAVSIAYDFEGLNSVPEIRRLLQIAATDALGLPNDLPRVRALGYLAQVSVSLLEKREWEERLSAVETAIDPDRHSERKRR